MAANPSNGSHDSGSEIEDWASDEGNDSLGHGDDEDKGSDADNKGEEDDSLTESDDDSLAGLANNPVAIKKALTSEVVLIFNVTFLFADVFYSVQFGPGQITLVVQLISPLNTIPLKQLKFLRYQIATTICFLSVWYVVFVLCDPHDDDN